MQPYYSADGIDLYHGDCREILHDLTADVIVTDPPYGYGYASSGGPRGHAPWRDTSITGDDSTRARDDVLAVWSPRPALVFGSWKRPKPTGVRAVLVWDKGGAAGMGDLSIPWKPNWEEIYVIGKGFTGPRTTGVLTGHRSAPSIATGRLHPNEKPVSLLRELLDKCPPGPVLDPFAGSGSTLVAARELGRASVGVEIDEKWCEVIARRLSKAPLMLDTA